MYHISIGIPTNDRVLLNTHTSTYIYIYTYTHTYIYIYIDIFYIVYMILLYYRSFFCSPALPQGNGSGGWKRGADQHEEEPHSKAGRETVALWEIVGKLL